MMQELNKVGIAYLVSIANFYYQSEGFTKFHNHLYAYWKVVPIFILVAFVVLHGGGMSSRTRFLHALALMAGALGDYLIGLSPDGLVPGATAFGVGHVLYMLTFVPDGPRVIWPLVFFLLAWSAIVGSQVLVPLLMEAPLPVLVLLFYGFLLSTTVVFAASQCYYGTERHSPYATGLLWRLLAFALFYVSDTVLIFNHTGHSIPKAEVVILSTYYAAQYLIVRAAVASEPKKAKAD